MTTFLSNYRPASNVPEATGMDVSVTTLSDKFSFACKPGDSLLGAGLAAGFDLPYGCATGTCGSCHARVMQGTVDPGWAQAPAYAKLRRADGDILMCQASPSSDCVLRVRSRTTQPLEPRPVIINRVGTVALVRKLTHDVIHFEVDLSEPMDFKAGQFVTLKVPNLIGRRAYSMVNFDADANRLSFVVKRKPGGGFSEWLFDGHPAGSQLDIMGPLGHATFRSEEGLNLVCIAGGSGIAGMMSMLEQAVSLRYFETHRGSIFFGVRSLADCFYLERFDRYLAAAGANLEVVIAISHEELSGTQHPDFPRISIAKGFVHAVVSARMKGRWGNEVGYVAGPEPMVNAALKVLIAEAELPPTFIRYDKFS